MESSPVTAFTLAELGLLVAVVLLFLLGIEIRSHNPKPLTNTDSLLAELRKTQRSKDSLEAVLDNLPKALFFRIRFSCCHS